MPKVDNEYVLVGSEWYLNGDGIKEPASLDMSKARARMADWVTFNGYANQYVTHPLTADPGETTRFWVVAAGPDEQRELPRRRDDLRPSLGQLRPGEPSTERGPDCLVPAGGGAVFDVKIDDEGTYPFVSHAFADVDLGPGRSAQGRESEGDDVALRARPVLFRWYRVGSDDVHGARAGRRGPSGAG